MSLLAAKQQTEIAQAGSACADDPRWQLTVKVSESTHFRKSALLAQFLLFICEHALNGAAEELTEQAIGEQVFRRQPGYSTGEDNIVRSYAHRLRSRLDRYFQENGREEPYRIIVPRGGYTPIFEQNQPLPANPQPELLRFDAAETIDEKRSESVLPQMVVPLSAEHGLSKRQTILLAAAFLLAGACLGVLYSNILHGTKHSPAHALWAQMFSNKAGTLIVTTDNSLGWLQYLTGRNTNLHDYMDRSFFAQFDQDDTPWHRQMHRLSEEHLTSTADTTAASDIMLLPEASGNEVRLLNARTLQLNDLKQPNIVLLGSNYGNPWVTLFEPHMNFQVNYHATDDTYASQIINRNPQPGEPSVLYNESIRPPYTTYAIVALMPNLEQRGCVLMIEGNTMAGTEAAAEFAMHEDIQPFLREATRNGSIRPFEIVLKTTNLDAQPGATSILLKRIY